MDNEQKSFVLNMLNNNRHYQEYYINQNHDNNSNNNVNETLYNKFLHDFGKYK
jgi:hypothetical protein